MNIKRRQNKDGRCKQRKLEKHFDFGNIYINGFIINTNIHVIFKF